MLPVGCEKFGWLSAKSSPRNSSRVLSCSAVSLNVLASENHVGTSWPDDGIPPHTANHTAWLRSRKTHGSYQRSGPRRAPAAMAPAPKTLLLSECIQRWSPRWDCCWPRRVDPDTCHPQPVWHSRTGLRAQWQASRDSQQSVHLPATQHLTHPAGQAGSGSA
jgi:hypothetical protein